MRQRQSLFAVLTAGLWLAGCSGVPSSLSGGNGATSPPPVQAFEGAIAVDLPGGRAAAQLLADPSEIGPGGMVVLRVENRGDLTLTYGRPIRVERWDGLQWTETADSRDTAWTMDLIVVPAGEGGIEQRWPFQEAHHPDPGWYRFTKEIQTEAAGASAPLVVMARVRVTGP